MSARARACAIESFSAPNPRMPSPLPLEHLAALAVARGAASAEEIAALPLVLQHLVNLLARACDNWGCVMRLSDTALALHMIRTNPEWRVPTYSMLQELTNAHSPEVYRAVRAMYEKTAYYIDVTFGDMLYWLARRRNAVLFRTAIELDPQFASSDVYCMLVNRREAAMLRALLEFGGAYINVQAIPREVRAAAEALLAAEEAGAGKA